MRRLSLAAAALVLALSACGGSSSAAKPGVSLDVGRDPFRLTLTARGKTVVQQNTDARFRYQLASTGEQFRLTKVTGGEAGVYRVATSERGRTATVSVRRTRTGFHVSLRLHPETNVAQIYDAWDSNAGEHFLGGGERGAAVDLRGEVLPVKLSYRCSYAPVPFFASSGGWGLRLVTDAVAGLAFPGSPGGAGCSSGGPPGCAFPPLPTRTEVCVKGARLDYDLYAGSLPQLLARYETDAGRPRVPPPSQLALMKWRDEVAGPDDLFEDVARLRAAGIPIGWVMLDNPWETCVGSLEFDHRRIPDPAGVIRRLHAQDVRLMLWVSPKIICPSGYPARSILGTGSNRVLDLRDPAVLKDYESRIRRLRALGVDGVKGDRGDEAELEPVSPTLQNEYARLYAKAVLSQFPSTAASVFRAATTGSQQLLPGLWAGDQPGDWTGLQIAIRQGQTAAMSGFPTWGSDVGGYASANLTAEVFARWTQLGAVSPIMEIGGIGPNATPWTLGPDAMAALKASAILHYELFPYLYGLLRQRQPVIRPLGFRYPGDANAWKAQLEFLVGPDLLAAPVTGPGTTPSVYLPPGAWIDLYRGSREDGGRALTRPTPLTELPLYVRDGAVVPFNLRTADTWWGVDELTHAGRAGWLATPGARLDLRGQPHDVQVFVPLADRPAAVTIGGRKVAWTWHDAPMPGAVVRLHGPTVRGVVDAG